MLLDHWRLVAKHDYRIPRDADLSEFTAAELAIVKKYGTWMEALERQSIAPITRAQRQFLRACGGEEEPVAEFAIAWKKLKESVQPVRRATKSEWLQESQDESPRIWTACPMCRGSSRLSGRCPRCNGTGWLDDSIYRTA